MFTCQTIDKTRYVVLGLFVIEWLGGVGRAEMVSSLTLHQSGQVELIGEVNNVWISLFASGLCRPLLMALQPLVAVPRGQTLTVPRTQQTFATTFPLHITTRTFPGNTSKTDLRTSYTSGRNRR